MVRLRVIKLGFRSRDCFSVTRINNERGIALVLSLVMLVLLAILGAWVLNTSSTELRIAGNATSQERAFYCGDAGIAYATNDNLLKAVYVAGLVTAAQSFPGQPITLGNCRFNGTITYLTKGQLANQQGQPYNADTSGVDTSNTLQQKYSGLYYVVDSSGSSDGNTTVPVQMGIQQVVKSSN